MKLSDLPESAREALMSASKRELELLAVEINCERREAELASYPKDLPAALNDLDKLSRREIQMTTDDPHVIVADLLEVVCGALEDIASQDTLARAAQSTLHLARDLFAEIASDHREMRQRLYAARSGAFDGNDPNPVRRGTA